MNNIYKSAVGLVILAIVSKVLGFGREVALATYYGASMYSDAYITAVNIPTLLFIPFSTAIGVAVTPLYFKIKTETDEVASMKYLNNTINIMIVISLILIVLVQLFPEIFIKITAIGFKGEIVPITVVYTKIMVWSIPFIGLSNIMTSYLQIHKRYTVTGLIGIPYNIIIILSIILSTQFNYKILGYGTLIALATNFFFQYPFAKREGYKYFFEMDIFDENIKKMIWLVAPLLVGVGVNQVNGIVDRTIASTLVEGSISSLNYANRIIGLVSGIIIVPIASVIYPKLSQISTKKNMTQFNEIVAKSINIVIILVIPISFGFIALAKEIVFILFERGSFDAQATFMTKNALIFYSIGMIGFGLRDILGKIFYSLHDTKTPMVNGVFAMILNMILSLILSQYLQHSGIALATSISSIVTIILLFYNLKIKVKQIDYQKIKMCFIKSFFASFVMTGIVICCKKLIMDRVVIGGIYYISIIFSILTGVLVYFFMLKLMKSEEIDTLLEIVRMNRGKSNDQL